jgi:hypothetical protein
MVAGPAFISKPKNQNQLKNFRQIFLLLVSSARDSKFEWYQPYPAPQRAYPMGFAIRCKIRCPKFLGVNAKEVEKKKPELLS